MARMIDVKQLKEITKQMKSAKKIKGQDKEHISVSEAKGQMRDAILAMYKKGYNAKQIVAFLKNLNSPVIPQTKEINKVIAENAKQNDDNKATDTDEQQQE